MGDGSICYEREFICPYLTAMKPISYGFHCDNSLCNEKDFMVSHSEENKANII